MKIKKYAVLPLINQHIVTFIVRPVFRFFLRVSVKGLEHLDTVDSNVIFAPNHQSELDPVILTTFLPKKLQFLPVFYATGDKKTYKYMGGLRQFLYGGTLFKIVGGFPIYFGLGDYKESLKHHISILHDNHSVLIFPEGKRSKDNSLLKPKGGISYLAYATKRPVVPVYIKNTYAVTPKSFLMRKYTIEIIFHKPITYNELFEEREYHSADKEAHEDRAQYIFNQMKL